jgi:hypothetical protein
MRIYEAHGPTTVWLDARFSEDGSLVIDGYDQGEAPRQMHGRDDLEYELAIPEAELRKTLLALLRAYVEETGTPVTAIRKCLDDAGVSHSFRILP